ncbi:hypothetical protein [Carboxydothermus islandicus]|nr:hypothetical protein [Carboxydothermus islandicus]
MLYDLDTTDFSKKLSYLQSYEKQLLERFCSYAQQKILKYHAISRKPDS